jgi:serine/threonine protein kinase
MGDDRPVGFLVGFSLGSRIAGYRLEEKIGEGGMAVVFRAQDERLQRQVALKILSPALTADEKFRRRFIRESRSAAAVDDPHIIPVFDAGDANGVLFIAMRYVPGGDVGTLVRRLGPLPSARAAAVVSAVASALDAAHAAGLVHRDVKPANMLVDARPGRPDHVYLSDFGLTKSSSSTSLTSTGHFMGTLDYSAPEQIRGQQVDPRTDEYALACVAFTLLSGAPPFRRDQAMAVMYAHLSAPPPMLTSLRPDLPPAVDEVMQRGLAKAPEDRYRSCGMFADALRIALGLRRYNSDPANAPHQQALTDHAAPLAIHASLTPDPAARRSEEAIERHQRALVDQRHAPAPDQPDTLATRFSIAQQLAARGNHAEAEQEFRDLLPRLRRRLGPDHPDTLATWFSIAQQLAARGDHAGAQKEFRYMLPHLRRKLGPDHAVTLAAAEWIDYIQAKKDDRSAAPRPPQLRPAPRQQLRTTEVESAWRSGPRTCRVTTRDARPWPLPCTATVTYTVLCPATTDWLSGCGACWSGWNSHW